MNNTNTILSTLFAELSPLVESWLNTTIKDAVRKALEEERAKARPESYLTRKESAEALKISLPTLWKLTKEGKIKSANVGRSVKYAESEVKRFQQANS